MFLFFKKKTKKIYLCRYITTKIATYFFWIILLLVILSIVSLVSFLTRSKLLNTHFPFEVEWVRKKIKNNHMRTLWMSGIQHEVDYLYLFLDSGSIIIYILVQPGKISFPEWTI